MKGVLFFQNENMIFILIKNNPFQRGKKNTDLMTLESRFCWSII